MEKYFVAYFTESGSFEGIEWCETEKQARNNASEWKKNYSQDAKNIIVGELLVSPQLDNAFLSVKEEV